MIFCLSEPYQYGSELTRPTLTVAGLLVLASFFAFFGLSQSLNATASDQRKLLLLIISFAISTRLVAMFTCPILEIDYYRYLWDGKAASAGVSPYHYSPQQVIESGDGSEGDLKLLYELSARSESNQTILERIHFEDYTTIYPPVSQAVFALTMKWFPDSASVQSHIIAIKSMLILFDVATLFLVYLLLRALGQHIGWLIVYAWNPLVIKEIANGSHLDSIATFLMVLSVLLLVKWRINGSRWRLGCLLGSGIALALGVGAKLFPVILFPALMIAVASRSWAKALLFGLIFAVSAAAFLWPMFSPMFESQAPTESVESFVPEGSGVFESLLPPDIFEPPESDPQIAPQQAKNGSVGFFSHWQMNDVAFASVYRNLKSSESGKAPWFVVTSNQFREQFEQTCRDRKLGGENPAFFSAKLLTLGLFSIFYVVQLLFIYRAGHSQTEPPDVSNARSAATNLVRRLTFILALFLFLQPTVNPWYFVWVLPLACVSLNRGWLLASGFLLVYYTRFWFQTLDKNYEFLGHDYSGLELYDHLVTWITVALILVVLGVFRCRKICLTENAIDLAN